MIGVSRSDWSPIDSLGAERRSKTGETRVLSATGEFRPVALGEIGLGG